ncbi:glycosyltransferase family 2 protein [Fructilactobacillus cliffordii]|uniref:glycosyltransferase family 2 protein n=1 Tax=Fructilactobacillus cliffordii TaxID=2940299 RepID=UPI0020924598|nr:glycosyltransferase family 2 protein [Fructilactobacillus cliffordii]USS85855.1 glycosyltransferase family 2 protein [Fructilactobacillus cliffordii]
MAEYEVSVVLTTYNAEKTLKRAFDSIINQKTNHSFEVIIIDDGSSDDTVSMIKDYANQYDNVSYFSQENSGPSIARNNGIDHAQGQYILFSDDDDEYLPDYIEKAMEQVKQNKLVIVGIEKRLQSGEIVKETHSVLEDANDNQQMIKGYLVNNQEFDVGPWNKLFELSVIKQNSLYFINKIFEDSLFILKYLSLINYDEIGFVHTPEYILYKRNGSITNSYEKQLLDRCNKYISDVAEIVQTNQKLPSYFASFKARIYLYYVHRNILTNQSWNGKEQRNFLKSRVSSCSFSDLDNKYRVALLLARFMPNLYIKMYRKKMNGD